MAVKNVITTRTVEIGGVFHGPGFPLTLSDEDYRVMKGRGEVGDPPKKKEAPPADPGQGDGTKKDGDPPPDPHDTPPP